MADIDGVPVLECKNLRKSYTGGALVLEKLNISVPQGRIVGLLGPNGCGKTTLIKLVAGLLVADAGQIFVMGRRRSEMSNSLISYLPERCSFDADMTVEAIMDMYADFYADFDRGRAQAMLEDMSIRRSARLHALSKGTREKVQLIMTMARRAKLYLLDEPIAGVDPAARDYILETVISSYEPTSTVIITTHLIRDIEEHLDDFIFMGRRGEILLQGDVRQTRLQRGRALYELFREVFRC